MFLLFCVCVGEADTILSPSLRSLLLSGKKRDQTETLTMYRMVIGHNLWSITFFGNLKKVKKITALRSEITLTAPPGEWIYKLSPAARCC